MGWMIEGSSPGRGWKFFSSPPRPDRLWSPLSQGWPGREDDNSPPSSVEVKSALSYTSTLPIRLHDVVLS